MRRAFERMSLRAELGRNLRAQGELQNRTARLALRHAPLEVQRSVLPRRNRHNPRRGYRTPEHDRLAMHDKMVVEDLHEFAPATLRIAAPRLRVGHRHHQVLAPARMPERRDVVVSEAARAFVYAPRAYRREWTLPHGAFVRNREVGMAGERDGVRERR